MEIICPHYSLEGIRGRCALGDCYFLMDSACVQCRAEAGDQWPPAQTPPAIVRIQTASRTPARPVVANHPEFCAHQLRVLDHGGCCKARTWFCEVRGVVDYQTCLGCEDFKEDSPTIE